MQHLTVELSYFSKKENDTNIKIQTALSKVILMQIKY